MQEDWNGEMSARGSELEDEKWGLRNTVAVEWLGRAEGCEGLQGGEHA